MQVTRKIVYASISNQNGAQTIHSAASTWGELKSEATDIDLKSQGMKSWVKSGDDSKGHALTNDGQALPTGDFLLYFLVEKNDSGTK